MKTKLTKKELFRLNNYHLGDLRVHERRAKDARLQLVANVAAYFGVEPADEVECQTQHRGTVKGVVRDVRFHHPLDGRKLDSVGAILVRPWRKASGPRELCSTDVNDIVVSDRTKVKLIAKDAPEGRRFKCR